MRDVEKLALAMPGATQGIDDEGRPSYLVHDKVFCWHRSPRPDALDSETGERLEDVFVFHVGDLEEKELILADPRGLFFTTPHWNGYRAVLIRIPDMKQLDRRELADLVTGAWLARAPRREAKAWLVERGLDDS